MPDENVSQTIEEVTDPHILPFPQMRSEDADADNRSEIVAHICDSGSLLPYPSGFCSACKPHEDDSRHFTVTQLVNEVKTLAAARKCWKKINDLMQIK